MLHNIKLLYSVRKDLFKRFSKPNTEITEEDISK